MPAVLKKLLGVTYDIEIRQAWQCYNKITRNIVHKVSSDVAMTGAKWNQATDAYNILNVTRFVDSNHISVVVWNY